MKIDLGRFIEFPIESITSSRKDKSCDKKLLFFVVISEEHLDKNNVCFI